jgi:hypothetical protein
MMPGIHALLPHDFLKKDSLSLARLDARGKGSVVPSCVSIVTRVLFPRLVWLYMHRFQYQACCKHTVYSTFFLLARSLRLSKTDSYTIPAF